MFKWALFAENMSLWPPTRFKPYLKTLFLLLCPQHLQCITNLRHYNIFRIYLIVFTPDFEPHNPLPTVKPTFLCCPFFSPAILWWFYVRKLPNVTQTDADKKNCDSKYEIKVLPKNEEELFFFNLHVHLVDVNLTHSWKVQLNINFDITCQRVVQFIQDARINGKVSFFLIYQRR